MITVMAIKHASLLSYHPLSYGSPAQSAKRPNNKTLLAQYIFFLEASHPTPHTTISSSWKSSSSRTTRNNHRGRRTGENWSKKGLRGMYGKRNFLAESRVCRENRETPVFSNSESLPRPTLHLNSCFCTHFVCGLCYCSCSAFPIFFTYFTYLLLSSQKHE